MTTDKNYSGQYCFKAESQKLYSHITQGQDNVIPFLAGAGWFAHFKRQCSMKNAKFAIKADSADQEVAKEF